MNRTRQRRPRLRLDPVAYDDLRQQVLDRDRWRCQLCGSQITLEVHHLEPRSHLGDDRQENLITLCITCHEKLHRGDGRIKGAEEGSMRTNSKTTE